MYPTIMPPQTAPETPATDPAWLADLTPAALEALGITDHADLFADEIDGETTEERAARLAAAADILDDRLTEIAHHALTTEAVRGWTA